MKTVILPIFFIVACVSLIRAAESGASGVAATPTSTASATTTPVRIAVLVAQTVAQNPEIRFYENEIKFAKDRHAVAGRWSDPELAVDIGRKSSREASGAFAGDGLAWGVTISQTFDFSGRNALRKAIAEREVERAEAGLAQFRQELAARASELGYTLLAAQQRMEAAEEVKARGRALLAALVQRDPAGVAAILETRIIEADIYKIEKSVALQRTELLVALAELNMLRGLPPETPLTLSNDTAALLPAPENSALFANAFRDNFTLRQFELDLQTQGLAVNLERKSAYGDITISPYYNQERAGGTDRFVGVGVSVPLPLWNGNKAGIADARSREGQANTALLKARRDLHKEIISAATAYQIGVELLTEWDQEKLELMRKSAELGDRHYLLGTISVSTYLALQQAYLDSVETFTSTRADAIRSAAKLTTLTGMPLETFLQKTDGAVK